MTLAVISSVLAARWSSKAPPKPNLHQEKGMVTLWWSAVHLIHYSFLNSRETSIFKKYAQQIDMHWKLQFLPMALVNRKGPILLSSNTQLHVAQPTLQKLNELGYSVLPYLSYSPDLSQLTTIFSSISTTFCRENASITSRRPKMLSKSSSKPGAQSFTWQE